MIIYKVELTIQKIILINSIIVNKLQNKKYFVL